VSRNAPRYRATRISLALGTGIAVVAGGVFLAGNGNNGASTTTGADTSALVTTDGISPTATATATAAATKAKDQGEEDDESGDSSNTQPTSTTAQPAVQATAQPSVSTPTSRVSRGS
jgi:hypothetical protein